MGMIALIPARAGSKRIPGKNIRLFFGYPLIAYTIQAARDAGIFDEIIVSTDSEEIGTVAINLGVQWIKRSDEAARDQSADVEWIHDVFINIPVCNFMILRPTSPFRTAETIKRAVAEWDKVHCLKAIEKVKQHPGKMWKIFPSLGTMKTYSDVNKFQHLQPIQRLESLYVQNGCIEIRPGWSMEGTVGEYQFFFTEGHEGFDINTEDDWIFAEALVDKGIVKLQEIDKEQYESTI